VEGRSQRQVAKELGISRLTVRKYVTEAVPIRRETKPRGRPVWDQVKARLKALLAESPQWTGGKVHKHVNDPIKALLVQNQQPVETFRSGAAHEPLSNSVASEYFVKTVGEFLIPIANHKPDRFRALRQSPRQLSSLGPRYEFVHPSRSFATDRPTA
jgi:hypothetical protein